MIVTSLLSAISATVPTVPSAEELRTLGSAVIASQPKGTRLLAACGPSQGIGYYLTPREDGWTDDPITKGRIIIVASATGEPNVFFQDAKQRVVSAIEDGADISFSHILPEKRSFGIIERYKSTGVVQTYIFSSSPNGRARLLWTTAKPHVSIANITKVTAHVADCI
jgi:hypothetical protein